MIGDFTGFSFNGIHSSRLGITRVSNGDRYDEELYPEISDRTGEIVGNDGENYYGSEYRAKNFTIEIAYDSMTEVQFRQLRRLFGTKKICELVFDERPYKVYLAKLANPIELEYVCFDEEAYIWSKVQIGEDPETHEPIYAPGVHKNEETGLYDDYEYRYTDGRPQRIYKGEGTIELIAYYPFARQQFKILDLYTNGGNTTTVYNNVDEWAASSGILTAQQYTDANIDKTILTPDSVVNYNLEIPVYNPGDLNTGFYLFIPFIDSMIEPEEGEDYIHINGDTNTMLLRTIYQKKSNENGVIINTVNHLIEGVWYDPISEYNDYRSRTWIRSGSIYNDCIAAGDFPQILRSDFYFDETQYKQAIYLNINCLSIEEKTQIEAIKANKQLTEEEKAELIQEIKDNATSQLAENMHMDYDYIYF